MLTRSCKDLTSLKTRLLRNQVDLYKDPLKVMESYYIFLINNKFIYFCDLYLF
ncbi:hypothetical protein HanRHA438_Chr17g0818591 [Helianthus annuus]|nr:hypothetical protein HanHA300_Chr17g0658841 [Helianthus annuus]KAJ0447956.1 hypothetical protein HanHA89_Chr17g0711231 [Helianthus annuus]KAJ0632850.1 hypothetical protein HanLR1_Chr17g0669801 [Helianthus annuus]KAJ0668114.1 hypothetical protein HanPI659440_Chr17g0685361 [Helianthus annuus]KAJ0826819.1 hypothetical protein HanRHA438_Chr17g0818591 [Helianthus annuus]